MMRLVQRIKTVAERGAPRVLIFGETGSGKELVAKLLHQFSKRNKNPLITCNCANLDGNLVQDELFGHEKGAYTDARDMHPGYFEQAHGGTLVLDEIGKLPKLSQGKLLRVLEDGKVRRLGGTREITVDVAVLAATNCNLWAMVKRDEFLPDLYERLRVVKVEVPPLREHISDVREIANHHWFQLTGEYLTDEQLLALEAYDYPGNVRELKAILDEAYYASEEDLQPLIAARRQERLPCTKHGAFLSAEEHRKAYVNEVYLAVGQDLTRAAEILNLDPRTIKRYVHKNE